MGYADGYYYGQGRIICDTSTFSVGDTIRVRSMTDSSKVWNQQVATVGTALVFTVPCYDYYKICTVQEISGTPTEIGGVYKTVDYGQTLFVDVLDKSTLAGHKGILNAHQEQNILNVGDEINITVSGTEKAVIILGMGVYNSHDIIYGAKETWSSSPFYSPKSSKNYRDSSIRQVVQGYYTNIAEKDRQYIAQATRYSFNKDTGWYQYQDYLWIASHKELFNSYIITDSPVAQFQFPAFVSASGRIRNDEYWEQDSNNTYGDRAQYVTTSGTTTNAEVQNSKGVVPCFMLVADS